MQNEFLHQASKLFPTFDHWQSFLELADKKDSIWESWFTEATVKIRRHFVETLPTEWACEPFGVTHRDTRWFLREFGLDSLGLSFSNHYRFDLQLRNHQKFDPVKTVGNLRSGEFRGIFMAFERIDRQFDLGSELIEIGNFHFQTPNDGNLMHRELAWHAAHQTNDFVDQAIAKIERFTNNEDVTALLKQLNNLALREPSRPVE